jgi:TP901 family phage tail tape measure protein
MATFPLGVARLILRFVADKFVRNVNLAAMALKRFSNVARMMATRMVTAGRAAISFAAILAGSLGVVVKVAAQFEKSMSAVAAVTEGAVDGAGNLTEQYHDLEAEIRRVAVTTRFTSIEVSKAAFFLGLAGVKADEIVSSLDSVVRLAAAGAINLARAAEVAADSLRAFRIQASNLVRVTDTLATVATNANTTVSQLGFAMSFASPAAAALGISLEEVTAALGALANAGLKGSTAGTGLARVLTMLAKRSEKVEGIFASYGLTMDELDPTVNSLESILRKLANAGLTVSDAMEAFNLRGGRIVLALGNMKDSFTELIEKNREAAGETLRMSDIMQDNLADAARMLVSQLQDLAIVLIGDSKEAGTFGNVLRNLINQAIVYIVTIKEWVANNRALVTTVLSIVSGVGAFVGVMGGAAVAIGLLLQAVFTAIGGFSALAAFLSGGGPILAGLAGIAALIALAAIPAFEALKDNWLMLKDTAGFVFSVIKSFWDAFVAGIKEGYERNIKPAFDHLRDAFEGLFQVVAMHFASVSTKLSVLDVAFRALGFAITYALSFVVMFIEAVVRTVTAIVLLNTKFLRLIGLASSVEEAEAAMLKRMNEVAEATTAAADALAALDEEYAEQNKALKTIIPNVGKFIDLMALGESMSIKQRKEAARLRGTFVGVVEQLENGIKIRKEQLAILEATLAAGNLEADMVTELKDRIRILNGAIDDMTNKLENVNELAEDNPEILADKSTIEANTVALERRQFVIDNMRKGTKFLADTEKDFAKIQADIRKKHVTGLEAEIEAINNLRDEQAELIALRLAANKAMGYGTHLRNEETKTRIAELEAMERTESQEEELNELRIKQTRDEATLVQALADETTLLADARALELKRIEEVNRAIKETLAAREAELLGVQIADAKMRGDTLRAAQLEADQIIEIERKKNKAIREEADAARAAGNIAEADRLDAIARERAGIAERKAKDVLRQAQEEVFGARDPVTEGVGRAVELEESITTQLAKQVNSLQDMFMLYQAIAMIRHIQEQRAVKAAQLALRMEQKARQAEAVAAANPGNARFAGNAERARLDANLAGGIAGNRAGEAGLGGQAAAAIQAQNQALKVALGDLNRDIAGLRDQFKRMMDAFPNIALVALGALTDSIRQATPQVVASVRAMVDAMNAEFARLRVPPPFGGLGGGGGLTGGLPGGVPPIAPGNGDFNNMVPNPTGAGDAGFVGGGGQLASAGGGTDNRTINMDITNNIDIDRVVHAVSRHFRDSVVSSRNVA